MFQYQIRIPQSMPLSDLMMKIEKQCLPVLNRHPALEFTSVSTFSKFRRELYRAFTPYLKEFDLCGTSELCEDSVHYLSGGRDFTEGKMYHLQLPVRLDLFLDLLASLLLKKMRPMSESNAIEKTRSDLKKALHNAIEPYLCTNFWCGRAQLCRYAKPVEPLKTVVNPVT